MQNLQNFRDYYEILGVTKDSSNEEIKKVYRRLARQYHPDLNPGNKEAEEKFKMIGEAYEILSDSARRSQYDQFSRYWQQRGFTGAKTAAKSKSWGTNRPSESSNLQDALYELNREVREYYAEDEDEDLFGAIREIFMGEKEKQPDYPREPYRESRSYNRDYGRDNTRGQNYGQNNRSSPSYNNESRRTRPGYQDNWDDDDDDWL